MGRWILTLLVLALVALPASGKRPRRSKVEAPSFTVIELDDGMTLVHVPREGAGRASLRYAVRAGGFDDPEKRGGLAHLLEHLIFHGSYDIPEGEIFEEARREGAYVNAFTSSSWTIYALDAPKDDFLPLLRLYVRMITNPALRLADLERERKVVDAEHIYHGVKSLLWAFDQQVFPSSNRGQTIIGTKPSRGNVTLDDLLAFYERHYVPSNTVVVVVGDLPLAEARRAVERSVLQPPEPPRHDEDRPPAPNVPSSSRILAWPTAVAVAYHLPDVEQGVCSDIARLLDLRLNERVRIKEPLASQAVVVCHRTRGTSFVVGVGLTRTLEGSRLPDLMKKTFLESKRVPPSSKERRLIKSRFAGELARLTNDPGELAMALADEAASREGDVEERLTALFRAPKLDWKAMRPVLEDSFVEDRHVLVQFSPFEHD